MSCYRPLKGFKIGVTANGKDDYKICSYSVDHLDYRDDKWHPMSTSDILPMSTRHVRDYIEIPCGKCIGCRLDYARSWADRCFLESLYHKSNWFVTLTYDDEHIPMSHYVDDLTGEYLPSYTLRKKDFQNFMKSLRSNLSDKVRYFACGEYGGKTQRPHYHALLFGLELTDLVLYNISNGNPYYNSPLLDRVWKKGFVVVTPLSYSTCAYTSRYVTKKVKQYDSHMFETFGMEPEFTLMSRKPGIGRQFYEDHDCYKYDYMALPSPDGTKKIYPMRYYDKQLEKLDPERYMQIKEKRLEMAKNKLELKLAQTDNDYLSMLGVEETNRMTKVDMVRNGIE